MSWEQERDRRYVFYNVYNTDMININKIHPLQQSNAINVVKAVEGSKVSKVMVFGSALNRRCNPWSDLDIAVWGDLNGKERSNVEMRILSKASGDIDIIWMEDIKGTNRILNDIKKGVVIYEQAAEEG